MNAMPDTPALDAGRLLACEAIVRCSTSPNAARLADWLRDLRLTQPLPKETDHAGPDRDPRRG